MGRADEFMAAARGRDDVSFPITTTETALLRELLTRFDSAYGRTSPEFRAFVNATVVCVDCDAGRHVLSPRMGTPCASCGGERAILCYHVVDPETLDAEDVGALGRLWREQASNWWQLTGRQTGFCDHCSAEMVRPTGSLHATHLLCDRCAGELLTDGLASLRRDPYEFGSRELRLARAFRSRHRADHLVLDWESLFSKFGFNDGDVPDDFDEWRAAQGLDPIDWVLDGEWHAILDEVVCGRLLPALNRRVEVMGQRTNHNPVRAYAVDGLAAEEYEQRVRDGLDKDLQPAYVEVPFREVERVLQEMENGLFPRAATVTDTVRRLGLTPRQTVELRAIVTSMAVATDEITVCALIIAGERDVEPERVRAAVHKYEVARTLAAHRAAELVAHGDLVPRTLDLEHWAAIHRHLYQDSSDDAGVARPGIDVDQQLAALRELTPATASAILAEVVPVMVEARPFASSLSYDDGSNTSSGRVLIQHALARVDLSIDWKWFGHDYERYTRAAELGELFDLAVS